MTPQAALPPPGQTPETAASPLRSQVPGVGARKKVLVLEDEAAFREVINDFLVENGYEVVAVQNGVDGVHELLAADFDVIVCDMNMPALSGDMFFRAVERMRPHLCDRFVFMTGHRGIEKINEFIAQVRGTVLMKPFSVDDLLEIVAFIQVRTAVHMVA